ncbi:hypothetical protein LX32DRAFT_208731 [Colletotrichum zoysiae]|uniref:Uncharacterized protein n=1 Tax=Colletotrichum zoysiae TaxID=1216348 RepID=A0AAD9M881_9PEZI|nr:hypothetical protein LX32DRAFT_208731 [Colletotrichum zoysiae]
MPITPKCLFYSQAHEDARGSGRHQRPRRNATAWSQREGGSAIKARHSTKPKSSICQLGSKPEESPPRTDSRVLGEALYHFEPVPACFLAFPLRSPPTFLFLFYLSFPCPRPSSARAGE